MKGVSHIAHETNLPFKIKKSSKLNKFARFRTVNNVRTNKQNLDNDLIIIEGCLESDRRLKILIDNGSQAELVSKEVAL